MNDFSNYFPNCFYTRLQPDLGPKILTIRGQRLQPEEWCAFMDNDGRIKDVQRLKERIFRGVSFSNILNKKDIEKNGCFRKLFDLAV